ncbi:MAG: GlsB/YeaQ/YmgE family stress response membrane protein [Candidatus Nephthysia bennettiae]|nr:MAG: GlsB/YeaQ/YmgE family stress response membrane protein [Candidatus Dormibacteraeota bacterium]
MELSPGGIIAWIVVGLVAGWLTGLIMKGGGYGIVGDLIIGLIGALIGGFIVGFFVHGSVGLIGSIIVAVIGAVILVVILRTVTGSRSRV